MGRRRRQRAAQRDLCVGKGGGRTHAAHQIIHFAADSGNRRVKGGIAVAARRSGLPTLPVGFAEPSRLMASARQARLSRIPALVRTVFPLCHGFVAGRISNIIVLCVGDGGEGGL